MKVNVKAHVVIRDKNGKIVREFDKTCKSYVRQFIYILRSQFAQASTSIIDTGNTARAITSHASNLGVNASVGVVSYGIVCGTGDNAVVIDDYKLQTLIAHGTGAGQLSYGACSVGVAETIGTKAQFVVARTMTNNSGSAITVKEVGLYCFASPYYFCIERTLLEFEIANGESGTVTYTISIVV